MPLDDVASRDTFLSRGIPRLSALWRAVMHSELPLEHEQLFSELLSPWGTSPVPPLPRWPSDIGDDSSPFELSLALGGVEPELRILVEAQGSTPTVQATWEAGCALSERLEHRYGADLTQLRKVEDLFRPRGDEPVFSIWHAVCLFRSRAPLWKVYLNPQVHGRARAGAVVEEALVRLGQPRAWPVLSGVAGHRGPDFDELKYFALDLSPAPDARIKVYFRHHDVTAAALERSFGAVPDYAPGQVTEFCRAMLESDGPFTSKPVGSCFSFVGGDAEAPTNATLHLPVARYVADDAVVHRRVSGYLQAHGMPVRDYAEPIAAFANRRLEDGVGMHSYASWRCERGKPRVTLYLAPELFRVEPPVQGAAPHVPARSLPPAEEIVRDYERNSMAEHPLFQRLQREPVDLRRLWLLLANARVGIVQGFARRLASVTARVPDERLRCLLAKQLNDELGNGDFTRAHHLLFDGLLAGLDRWRPAEVDEAMLAAGRALAERLEAIYGDPEPYVGVGAAMVIEIYGKQVDLQTGRELRRQHALDPGSLTWLTLHEELELDHAEESMTMAHLVGDGPALAGAWRGARATCAASWAFFDDVYALCFG